MTISRRVLLAGSASLVAADALAQSSRPPATPAVPLAKGLPPGVAQVAELAALPGKKPLLRLSHRPPNYETPVSYFTDAITPNDAFFVRYHLSEIPEIDPAKWSMTVSGGQNAITLDLAALKAMPAAEVVAVCQCSGNRRGLSNPHVAGVEWGYGAMGCARWKGARLKDVLASAGVPQNAVEIAYNGADFAPVDKTPDFAKSLPMWKALDENTLLAYEMNGAPLPHWNGAPVRLVAPGWTATYWMKHITDMRILDKPFDGFWMKSAYRIPVGLFPTVDRFVSQETATNTPITEMVVNSLIVSPPDGAKIRAGRLSVAGLAWDGGRGVERVDVSIDEGGQWRPAKLGDDLGRFAFRAWRFETRADPGPLTILARATNAAGQTQVSKAIFNAAGYHHNVVSRVSVLIT